MVLAMEPGPGILTPQIERDNMRIRGTPHCFVSDLFQIVNAATPKNKK
jgi:hypothetical protein